MKTKHTIIAIAAVTLMASANAGLLSGGKGLSTLNAAPVATAPVDNAKVTSAADAQTKLLQAQDDVYNFHRSWNSFETKRVRNEYSHQINPHEDYREQGLPFTYPPSGSMMDPQNLRSEGLAKTLRYAGYPYSGSIDQFEVKTGETLEDFEKKYGPHLMKYSWTHYGCNNVNDYFYDSWYSMPSRDSFKGRVKSLVHETIFVFGDMDKHGNPVQIYVKACDGMVDNFSSPHYLPGTKAETVAREFSEAREKADEADRQRRIAADAAEKAEKAKAPVVQSTGFKLKPRGFKE